MISLRVREELIRGDFRCLYLAWLFGVQNEWVELDAIEPAVPDGLGELSGALTTFIRFMRIDPDLVTVAARSSEGKMESGREQELARWIHELNATEKDDFLCRIIAGNEPHPGNRLYQQFIKSRARENNASTSQGRRTAGELLEQAESWTRERQEREVREQARRHAGWPS